MEIGFGLLDDAKAYAASGQPELTSRALESAAAVVADLERRLQRLDASESAPFLPLVAELRNEITELESANP